MRKSRKKIKYNKSVKLARRKKRSLIKKRNSRRQYFGLTKMQIRIRQYLKQNWDFERIKAPKDFSFVGNTTGVISFINRLQECFEKQKKVFVVLRNIDNLTYDALVVLLSIMVKFKSKKIGFNGDFPKNPKAYKLLEKSGFMDYLYFNDFKRADRYDLPTRSRIHTHAMKKVDSVLGDRIITEASKTIWGEKRRCQGVQRTFLELMLNTNNHAELGMEGVKHWWLSVFHIEKEKKVTFSFVDFGVGIFNNLENKTSRSKWYGWGQKLAKAFKFDNNADLLKLILEGKLHTTVTGKPYRGKGLPGLKVAMDRNQISKLHIISNNVKADILANSYTLINQNFNGTFVYWEVNETNENCDGNA